MFYLCIEVFFLIHFRKYKNICLEHIAQGFFVEHIQEKAAYLFANSDEVCYVR